MNIYDKIKKDSTFVDNILKEDEKVEFLNTGIISLNLLFSGKVDAGIPIGKVSQIASEPSTGKSFIGLSILKSAQKRGMFCVIIDSEKSFNFDFAKTVGINTDKNKLLVIQNNSIEDCQEMVMKIFNGLSKEDRKNIFILIDSFGAFVTSKTIENATEGKDVADFTEAKKKNRFAKLLNNTDGTIFVINHVYENVGGFGDPKQVPGGKVLFFMSSAIVTGQSKSKEKNSSSEITGFLLTCKCHKSRFGRETSKLKFRIKQNGGLDVFYGLLPDALEHGCVVSPKQGKYVRAFIKDDKPLKENQIYNSDFWLPVFKKTDFRNFLEEKYSYKNRKIEISDFDIGEKLNKEEV